MAFICFGKICSKCNVKLLKMINDPILNLITLNWVVNFLGLFDS